MLYVSDKLQEIKDISHIYPARQSSGEAEYCFRSCPSANVCLSAQIALTAIFF